MDKLKIYVDPPPAPRMPPVEDVNNTDLMLGVVVLAIGLAMIIVGVTVWWLR